MRQRIWGVFGAAMVASVMLTVAAEAAPRCRNTGSFDRWMEGFKKDAAAQGISQRAISMALDGVKFDPAIIRRDSGQGVFQQSFQQFAGRMTGGGRYENGVKQMKANASLMARIEQQSGVPPAVVVALWGLESDYGAYKGGIYNIIQSVATDDGRVELDAVERHRDRPLRHTLCRRVFLEAFHPALEAAGVTAPRRGLGGAGEHDARGHRRAENAQNPLPHCRRPWNDICLE